MLSGLKLHKFKHRSRPTPIPLLNLFSQYLCRGTTEWPSPASSSLSSLPPSLSPSIWLPDRACLTAPCAAGRAGVADRAYTAGRSLAACRMPGGPTAPIFTGRADSDGRVRAAVKSLVVASSASGSILDRTTTLFCVMYNLNHKSKVQKCLKHRVQGRRRRLCI